MKSITTLSAAVYILLAAALIHVMMSEDVHAFHRGSVGQCEGCHSMHNAKDIATNWLLAGTDPGSVCLNCHAGIGSSNSPHIASPDGSAMSPGGDFYWVQKDFTWMGGASAGDSHGHNIIAQDYGFIMDTRLVQAPGGTYLASDLSCTSCHDPHGKNKSGLPVSDTGSYGGIPAAGTALGSFRLLGGTGYDGGAHVQGHSFTDDVPVARQSSSMQYAETDSSHVDYGSGMSEWCANCHSGILNSEHKSTGGSFEHPAGNNALLDDFVSTYNSYVKTGDFTGIRATAYLALVPFERGETDINLLDPASTQGPDSSSNIMCLTCHRAHASAFPFSGRWDFTAQLVADSHPAAGDAGVTGNDLLYSYYGRDMATEFGTGQRILCEKCHDVPKDGYPPGW